MNIVIPTIGIRGDVQPYIALSLGLQKSGHAVTLVSHPCMRTLVESYSVKFAPIRILILPMKQPSFVENHPIG
ncbi:MAG: hypothetical protein CVU41_10725 [Chloroflexi bacterium HGW-Chloroflexi-3]|nr:MAG: hypothetical protein CVU41_10725 [Chloroflexi bacterium HGW-Chloroflexi-3]